MAELKVFGDILAGSGADERIPTIDEFNFLSGTSGYQTLPSGLIMQWSNHNINKDSTTAYNFPIAFPTALDVVWGTVNTLATNNTCLYVEATSSTQWNARATSNQGGPFTITLFAIGH